MALGIIWLALGGAMLYISAWWSGLADMRGFCAVWLMAWPAVTGFYAGWRRGDRGFMAGGRSMLVFALVIGLGWWWLFADLWDVLLWLKGAAYVVALGSLLGGLAVGLKQARPLPPAPPVEEEDATDEDET